MSLETEVQWDENERFAFCTCLKKKKKKRKKLIWELLISEDIRLFYSACRGRDAVMVLSR